MKTKQGIGCFALVMLMTGAIDSIRNLPAAALFGSTLIFFFIFATLVFLLPSALISAELSSTFTKESGIYAWIKLAFGEEVAFLAIWLQWVNTLVWYPTMLSFIAGTAAYLIDPNLVHYKGYLITVILGIFWGLTWLNCRGLHTSARFASWCTIAGMIIPMVLIILLAIVWIMLGNGSHLHLTAHNIWPNFSDISSWTSLTAIMTAFLGIELATVHVQQVRNPERTLPKAILFSTLIIMLTMGFGSLAIAIVLPTAKINLVEGVMQAFSNFLDAYHLHHFLHIMTFLLVFGSIGSMVNWMISPAKGLLQAADQGYLPKCFTYVNKHGVARNILLAQACLVSVLCLVFLLMPSVNGAYWLLTDLSTQLYMLMYIFMFLAALRLRYKFSDIVRPFVVPGGKFGLWLVCLLGLSACAITLFVGFIPPPMLNFDDRVNFSWIFGGGMLAMTIPIIFFYLQALNRFKVTRA